jgi:hypothetical protein
MTADPREITPDARKMTADPKVTTGDQTRLTWIN